MSTRRNDIRPHGVDKDAPHQVEIVASICQGRNYDAVLERRPIDMTKLIGLTVIVVGIAIMEIDNLRKAHS